MKTKLLLFSVLISFFGNAQTITHVQQSTNYDATFTNDGGLYNDTGFMTMNLWTWEAGGDGIMQVAAWKKFTDNGLPSGNSMTMAVGDSFKINITTSKSWAGQIGVSLLSSPSATAAYTDRHNNYAVQVNKNGDGPWEVVSSGGTIDATTITSGNLWFDYEFVYTLNTATTMTVVINKYTINDHAAPLETATKSVTLNNSNITGYSVYADNWLNGTTGYLFKQPTEYIVNNLSTLDAEQMNNINVIYSDSRIHINGLNDTDKFELKIYDLLGREIKSINKDNTFVELTPSLYIAKLNVEGKGTMARKLLVK